MLLLAGRVLAATISGFTPGSGPTGTEVTIFGTGLQTAMFAYFGGTEAQGQILSASATSVRARVPANALSGPISIFTSGSGAASSTAVFVAAPRVTDFDPATGAAGALVTISGANFGTGQPGGRGLVTNVLFNGTPARFEVTALNQLLALVPNEATTGPITVANEAGPFTTLASFQVPARITGFAPTNGMPGDGIEIRGANLAGAARVEFGLIPASFTVLSPTNLVAYVPTNALNSVIRVTTLAGVATTPSNFVVTPRIIRFSPSKGSAGTNVVLEGGGMQGVTAVEFAGASANFTARSSTLVEAVAPNNVGTGPIRIVTTNGTFTTTGNFTAPARISTVNPGSGRRGDLVTVDGQNLNGVTRVLLNGVEADFDVVSAGRLTFVVPALATTGAIAVETPAGTVTGNTTFTVRPVLDGFTPGTGAVGTAVHLSGAGLTNLSWVRLGGLDTSFQVINSTNVRAIVPLGAFSGALRIRTASGTEVQAPGNFFVSGAQPVLGSFTPTNGQAGVKVSLFGQGLATASRVQFGSLDAPFTVVSSGQVDTTVPAGAATAPIAVTTLDGIAISAKSFVVPPVQVWLTLTAGFGAVDIRWPVSATGFQLEESAALGSAAAWTAVAEPPVKEGTQWRVTVGVPETGERFYRLRK